MPAAILTFLPRYPLVTADHGARYHDKLRAFPAFVEGWCVRLRDAAADGTVPIRHLVQAQIALLDVTLAGPLSAGQLAAQRPPMELAAEAATRWTVTLHELLDGPVTRGFKNAARHARRSHAACGPAGRPARDHAPGGRSRDLRPDARASTSLDLTAAQIHEIGIERVARVEDECRRIGAPIMGTDDVKEIIGGFVTIRRSIIRTATR